MTGRAGAVLRKLLLVLGRAARVERVLGKVVRARLSTVVPRTATVGCERLICAGLRADCWREVLPDRVAPLLRDVLVVGTRTRGTERWPELLRGVVTERPRLLRSVDGLTRGVTVRGTLRELVVWRDVPLRAPSVLTR